MPAPEDPPSIEDRADPAQPASGQASQGVHQPPPWRDAQQRLALATRAVGIGTWESNLSAQTGWWDAQMFHLRGLPPTAGPVRTAEMLQWLHPDDRAGYQRQMQAALALDAPTDTEFRIVRPDGQVRWLASRSVPVRDKHGLTVQRIGINWDITDARLAAQAREDARQALLASQAKSRLLARLSHELRTPLNAVLGFSQLLLTDGPNPPHWQERLGHVYRAGQDLLRLVNEVMELADATPAGMPLPDGPAPQPPAAPAPPRQTRPSVLYIEDNEVNRLIVDALMRQRPDLRLLMAVDGRQGVQRARADHPGLILLDMQLPDIDGLEVLRQLRANPATATIPCIAVSANVLPEDIRAALDAGFDGYWPKPLDLQAFLRALGQRFGPGPVPG